MDLAGKRVLITRPRGQADSFAAGLHAAGAEPVLFPTIRIAPLGDSPALDGALRDLADYDWLVLTSFNGVTQTWKRLANLGVPGLPPGLRVAAIGPKTAAALQQHGVQPDFVPAEYVAEAILPGLGDLHGRRVLLLRADRARPALAQAIQAAGGLPDEIPIYQTLLAEADPAGLAALRQGVDVVTFTSASTVDNFVQLITAAGLDACALPGRPILACIGPITQAAAHQHGLTVAVVATQYTTEGLIAALQAYPDDGEQ
jgi:uroporphyrinogen-III synthase